MELLSGAKFVNDHRSSGGLHFSKGCSTRPNRLFFFTLFKGDGVEGQTHVQKFMLQILYIIRNINVQKKGGGGGGGKGRLNNVKKTDDLVPWM